MKSILFTIVLLFTITLCSLGQNTNQTMEDQFSDFIEGSETFKDYKVIKISDLNVFFNSIKDTISSRNILIEALSSENEILINQKEKAEQDLIKSNQEVEALNLQTTTINILGISVDKTAYKIFNSSIIFLLLALILFLFIKLKERAATTNKKIAAYNEIESKFENYKKDALDKQMKLRRELQTEKNMVEKIRNTN